MSFSFHFLCQQEIQTLFSQFDLKITNQLLPAVCLAGTRVNQQSWSVIAQQEARPQTTPCKSSGGWLYTVCALPVYRHG